MNWVVGCNEVNYVCCSVGVYCLREQALAHKSMVQHLREMLVLDAKDKEFLLSSISRVNEGRK